MVLSEIVKQRFYEWYGVSFEQLSVNPSLANGLKKLLSLDYWSESYVPSESPRPISAREADKRNRAILSRW